MATYSEYEQCLNDALELYRIGGISWTDVRDHIDQFQGYNLGGFINDPGAVIMYQECAKCDEWEREALAKQEKKNNRTEAECLVGFEAKMDAFSRQANPESPTLKRDKSEDELYFEVTGRESFVNAKYTNPYLFWRNEFLETGQSYAKDQMVLFYSPVLEDKGLLTPQVKKRVRMPDIKLPEFHPMAWVIWILLLANAVALTLATIGVF